MSKPPDDYKPKEALSGREIFAILSDPEVQVQVVRTIPCGIKQDVHFILPNFNKGRWETNQTFKHPADDCGAMLSSTKKYLYKFLLNEMTIEYVDKLDSYKSLPLNPDEKVIMKMINATKRSDKSCKRNIAYFVEAPEVVKQVLDYCLVEYLGFDQEGGSQEVHKNRKHGNIPYRKKPDPMTEVKNKNSTKNSQN